MLFIFYVILYSILRNEHPQKNILTWNWENEVMYLSRENRPLFLSFGQREQGLLLSVCGHSPAQYKHRNGRPDWVFLRHAACTLTPLTDWLTSVSDHSLSAWLWERRRGVLLTDCPSPSDHMGETHSTEPIWTSCVDRETYRPPLVLSTMSLAVSCPTIGLLHSLSLPILDSSHRCNMPVEFGIWVNLDVNLMTCGLWHPVCL